MQYNFKLKYSIAEANELRGKLICNPNIKSVDMDEDKHSNSLEERITFTVHPFPGKEIEAGMFILAEFADVINECLATGDR